MRKGECLSLCISRRLTEQLPLLRCHCCAHLKMGFRQFDLTKRSRNKQMLDFLMGILWLVTYRNLLETTEYRYIRTMSLYSVLRSRVLAQVPDPYYYRFENRVVLVCNTTREELHLYTDR